MCVSRFSKGLVGFLDLGLIDCSGSFFICLSVFRCLDQLLGVTFTLHFLQILSAYSYFLKSSLLYRNFCFLTHRNISLSQKITFAEGIRIRPAVLDGLV